ncbi:MAG: PDR/VanB family oxidoreductase [Allobranchiibius sp.]
MDPVTVNMHEFETELVVRAVERVAEEVVALTLARADGTSLPDWTPGAHIDVIFGDDLIRQYSLCGSTNDTTTWRVAVLRSADGRGGGQAAHALRAGATVRGRGPRNHFPIVAAPRYLFIAGGIGITPLLAMIHEVDAAGARWELQYTGRSRSTMAFTDELADFGDRVSITASDEVGRLDLGTVLDVPQPDTLIYACGPESMLEEIQQRVASWPPGSLHLERFAAAAPADSSNDAAFEVVLQRSGRTVLVGADTSVFDAVRAAGASVLGSCLEGICGTCETDVVEGEIDHRDSVLDEEERESGETMMICVSRCTSERLVLDL